jgi:hypothetical protein
MTTFIALIPLIIQIVRALEPLFAAGQGKTKASLALAIAGEVFALMKAGQTPEKTQETVSRIIDGIVAAFNANPDAWKAKEPAQ